MTGVSDGPRKRSAGACVPRAIQWAFVAPVVAASALVVSFVAFDMAGAPPLSYRMPTNMAEAAGMGSGWEVLRRLRDGEDPNAVQPVGPDVISSSIRRVSAVEAAVWGRRVQLLRLLEREGAIQGDETKRYLACLATIARVPAIVEHFAPGGASGCDEDRVLRQLEARAR